MIYRNRLIKNDDDQWNRFQSITTISLRFFHLLFNIYSVKLAPIFFDTTQIDR
ncbi:hypothetical protein C7S15_8617 [Burkholderia cepacia]|nr:hypothetical protein [Burkholderia cepacia]